MDIPSMYTEYVRPGKSRRSGTGGVRRSVRPAHEFQFAPRTSSVRPTHTEREEAESQPDQGDARTERDLLHPPYGRCVQRLPGPLSRISERVGRRGGSRQVDGVRDPLVGLLRWILPVGILGPRRLHRRQRTPGALLARPGLAPGQGCGRPGHVGRSGRRRRGLLLIGLGPGTGFGSGSGGRDCAPSPVAAVEDGPGPVPDAPEAGTPDGRGSAEGSAEGDTEPEGAGGEDTEADAVAAGLDVPGAVAVTDGGPSGADEPWAEPADGPSAAPAAASRQTAHLDDHAAGSPGAMRSASHGPPRPASRTRYPEGRGLSMVHVPVHDEDPARSVNRNDHLRTPTFQDGGPPECRAAYRWSGRLPGGSGRPAGGDLQLEVGAALVDSRTGGRELTDDLVLGIRIARLLDHLDRPARGGRCTTSPRGRPCR